MVHEVGAVKQRIKRWLFALLGKDPEAVVVTFCTGDPELCRRMVEEVRALIPERRHFTATPENWPALRKELSRYRIGLAPVMLTRESSQLRRAAYRLAPRKILAYNSRLERHHLGPDLASLLFWRGVPLDRIRLRPAWWPLPQHERSTTPQEIRRFEGRPCSSARSRVAVLAPYFPYPLAHGGAVRIYNLLREMAREFDVELFAFDSPTAADMAPVLEFCARVVLVEKPRYRAPRWSTLLPPEVHEFRSPAMHRAIAEERRAFGFQALQVEYTQLAPYGYAPLRPAPPADPAPVRLAASPAVSAPPSAPAPADPATSPPPAAPAVAVRLTPPAPAPAPPADAARLTPTASAPPADSALPTSPASAAPADFARPTPPAPPADPASPPAPADSARPTPPAPAAPAALRPGPARPTPQAASPPACDPAPPTPPAAPTDRPGDILVEHDVTFDLYGQIARRDRTLGAWWDFYRWRRFERRAARRYRHVVVMSPKDAGMLGPSVNSTVLENGVDLARFQSAPETPGQRLLFIGSFRHFPNISAYRFFIENVWPLLRDKFPEMTLTVVGGPDHLLYWREFTSSPEPPADDRIRLLGFVADVRSLYDDANLVIVPTTVSAGTNVKVLEAMAMRRAVVSTASGCAGLGLLHGHSVWVADPPEAFAAGIATLIADPDRRAQIAEAAWGHAHRNFDWQAIGEKQRRLLRNSMQPGNELARLTH